MSEPGRTASVARSSAGMAAGTLVSRVLGVVRLVLQTWALGGTTAAANAWTNANTLPNIVYLLLAGGMLNAILVPQLTKAMMRADGGRDFTDRLITLILVALAGVTVVFTLGAALLVKFYAVSFRGDVLDLAIAFAYICMPQIFFYGLYTLLGQILNSRDKFAAFMWAPALANLVGIAGLGLFLAVMPRQAPPGEWTGEMIWLLAGSFTLGIVLQAAILFLPVWRTGFRWRPRWGFRGVGMRSASRVAMWTFAIIALSQLGIWVTSNVVNHASTTGDGVAGRYAYEQASLLFVLPHSLITVSLVTALFPRMSRAAHRDDRPALRADLRQGLRLIGVATVPITLGLLVLGPALAETLLFMNTRHDAHAIAFVMMAMVLGLVPYGVYALVYRGFYAFEDGRTPFKLQLIITGVSVAGTLLALLLPPDRVAIGAGLAQAVGQAAAGVAGLLWMRRRVDHLGLHPVLRTYVRVGVAAVLAAAVAWAVQLGTTHVAPGRGGVAAGLVLGGLALLAVYVLVARRMRVAEITDLTAVLTRRLGR